ncbi:RHS repeat domain-containing protein, partial [Gilliamella intestini]
RIFLFVSSMRLTLARPTLKRCSNLFQTNLWQDHKLIAECADNDKFWRSYIYEPDSHRPLAQILGKAGQSEKLKTYWYQNNYLGTPHRLTDSLGDTVYECEYSAYGEITHEHWPQAENNIKPINPLRFQGQYFDEETGLHYNLNRYYDPFTGRYITQDPLGILGGLNSYQYAGSDPINWIDSLGLIKVENNGFESIAREGTSGNEFLLANANKQLDEYIASLGNSKYKPATAIAAVDPLTGKIITASSGTVPAKIAPEL